MPTTKNEREHTIRLSDFALRQITKIEALRESRIDDSGEEVIVPWLFPNSAATGPVNVKSFGKQLADRQRTPERRLKGRSKQTDSLRLSGGRWTARDWRRTTGTLMASIGISGNVIDECLNHDIESRVRRTYICAGDRSNRHTRSMRSDHVLRRSPRPSPRSNAHERPIALDHSGVV